MNTSLPNPVVTERQVPAEQAGERLDQVASVLFSDFSRARLQRWIRDGALTVDGAGGRPAQRLSGGEWLRLEARLEPEGDVVAQAIPLTVLHEDEQIIVLDKPPGLVVHPAAGHADGTMQNGLLHLAPELESVPRSGIVHRLDKDTSGVMVVARTLKAHAHLVSQLQDRRMGRVYEAVVHGLAPPRGTIDAPVGRHPSDRKRMAVVAGGKPAVSHFRRRAYFGHFSHLEVALESGRTHQIRVHVQHLGFPMVGDPVYGQRIPKRSGLGDAARAAVEAFPRQALHARTLKLEHPDSGERMAFTAPVPDDIRGLLDALAQFDPPPGDGTASGDGTGPG
ncbi:RluA family pseudouridine synthase [Marinihelvus fidelis]|uniref:Pseudouridine synthase n=1 Tax=Marinihelvus fidelis TaxID=2613842 RepID=A0A5N0T6X6_9GAMM|nr:RluA family pseudouridine synthase [Marinihelvus fidelis]KAA9129887.1 RluA family pseudouridine synthase [Marinihelvus fidelis]